jgi:8-oxo-dGTP pyrophosphatase MutT (NUDIX family)
MEIVTDQRRQPARHATPFSTMRAKDRAGRLPRGRRRESAVRTVRDVSAGGVVLREADSHLEVALVGRGQPLRWGLPKGGLQAGETIDRAAVREVQEETGLRVELAAPATTRRSTTS